MRRVQFLEIHELAWFPGPLRDQVTDALQCGMCLLGAYLSVVPLIQQLVSNAESKTIVDLGSGGGGPWLALSRCLDNGSAGVSIRLTDKWPNRKAFETIRGAAGDRFLFSPNGVDARSVPRALGGARTMFSTFHHFRPDEAVAVLQDAVSAGESIGVFEITRRDPLAIAAMFPWALLAFFYTPFIRPFRWSRLFWTYVLPVIPLVLLFDGVVSCLRTYRPDELEGLVARLKDAEYDWRTGEFYDGRYGMPVTYLLGWPKNIERATAVHETAQPALGKASG